MIIPMKKYSFLVFHNDYRSFLLDLQKLGVIQVITQKMESEEGIRELNGNINRLNKAIKFLGDFAEEGETASPAEEKESLEIVQLIETRQIEKERLNQELSSLEKESRYLAPWGDFSVETIEKLKKQGVRLRFFIISEKNYDAEWEKEYNLNSINQIGSSKYAVVFEKGEKRDLPIIGEEIKLPEYSISELNTKIQEVKDKTSSIDEEFKNIALTRSDQLKDALTRLNEKLDFESAVLSTENTVDDKVMILEGWVPANKEKKLLRFLEEKKTVFLSQSATPEDKVPILLKNNRFNKLFEPVGKMFSLPAYAEMDLTPFFAPFFALFFGLCLGDAAYGIFIIIACFIARMKVKKETKPIFTLGIILGFATVLIGVLTGTILGYSLINVESLNSIVIFDDPSHNDLFELSLYIGIIQILFGLCIQTVNRVRRYGFVYGLSTIGTFLLLVASIDLYQFKWFGPASNILLYVGLGLILLFNNPKLNIFLRPLNGIYDLYNIASGFLGDFLSYVRLFALGISSAILGLVINQISALMLGIPIIGPVIFIVFMALAHTGNLMLSGLGAFVHPMRLTFVEFYKNAGFEGGGKEFKPFAIKE